MITYPLIKIDFGGDSLEFSRENVIRAEVFEEFNQVGFELPASTIEFTIQTSEISLFDENYYERFYRRQPLMVYEMVDGVQLFVGKFYLDEWKNNSESEFLFRAVDILGVLSQIDFEGVFWSTATALSTVLNQVLLPVGVTYTVDGALSGVTISGWIKPSDYRQALQQICIASGATASTASSEGIVFSPVSYPVRSIYDRYVRNQDRLASQSIGLLPIVTQIQVVSHNYSAGSELETIFSETLDPGSYKIIFPKPYYDISYNGPGYTAVTLITEDGVDITTEDGSTIEIGGEYIFGPNSLSLSMTAPGAVVITGHPWIESQRAFTFQETAIQGTEASNTLLVDDATLVNTVNAQAVLDRMRDFYRMRYTQKLTLLPSTVQPGEHLLTRAYRDNRMLGAAEKVRMNLTTGFLAEIEIRGIDPQYIKAADDPVRTARTGVAACGANLRDQNFYRRYA